MSLIGLLLYYSSKKPPEKGVCYTYSTVYRSVPPVSTTSTMSSRTDRISFPLLVVSKRNSAKLGDMIIIVSFTKWDLHSMISLILSEIVWTFTIPIGRPKIMMLREWGNDLGFTQLPKFTYWESLTPEPPPLDSMLTSLRSLIKSLNRFTDYQIGSGFIRHQKWNWMFGAVEPHIPQHL